MNKNKFSKWVILGSGIVCGAVFSEWIKWVFEPWSASAFTLYLLVLMLMKESRLQRVLLFVLAFLYGYSAIALATAQFDSVAWRSPKKIIILRGHVTTFPENSGSQARWNFKLSQFRMEEGAWQKTRGQVEIAMPSNSFAPLIGDELILKGTIRFPSAGEPGAARTRRRFFLKNRLAQIRVKKIADVIVIGFNFAYLPLRVLQIVREAFASRIFEQYSKDQEEVMSALLLGTQVAEPMIRKVFSKTGTSHLLSVSGFHTSVIVGVIFSCVVLLRFNPAAAVTVSSLGALAYMALTGWGVAVQRAGLMAILVWVAWILGRPQNLLYWLNFSFAILVWVDPKNVWDISFQLSFLSMYGIILVAPQIKRVIRFPGLDISLAAFFATYPVVLFYFQSFSWIGIFANLIAVPAFALILPLGFFALIPGVGALALAPTKMLLILVLGWLQWIAMQPWSCLGLQQPQLIVVILYYFLGGMVLWLGHQKNAS